MVIQNRSKSRRLLEEFTYVAPSVIIPRPKWAPRVLGKTLFELQFKQREQGLFAKKYIPAGTFLGEYTGEEVTLRTLGDATTTYVLWQKSYEGTTGDLVGYIMDRPGRLGDNWLRFANHQDEEKANLVVREDYKFYTKRHVRQHEELTWTYGRGIKFS